jgi:hypothetical protein
MGRKILFITTDQQRYDSLGCNGGEIARTPAAASTRADLVADLHDHLPPARTDRLKVEAPA